MDCFEKGVCRRGTNCYKWDTLPEDVIPMWVADMDFETAPCIKKAVMERAAHGAYGYTSIPKSYYESVCNWFATRHGWRPDPSWIVPAIGVVPGISACLEAFTRPGDKVIVLSPIYNCFYHCIHNYDCEALEVPLVTVHKNDRPTYAVDFDALRKAASDPKAKVMLVCSPHNPAGRIWTREELLEVGRICLSNGVLPVVDEIHCEFIMPGGEFTPFATVSPEFETGAVILNSASKAFNIAGLQIASIFCADPVKRAKIEKAVEVNYVCDVNPFGVVATQAAYTDEGAEWLRGLNERVWLNYKRLEEIVAAQLPEFPLYLLEATYLCWLDCRCICYNPDGSLRMSSEDVEKSITDCERVRLNNGAMYGGEGFLRINLACPPAILEEGLARMVKGLRRLLSSF